MKIQSNSLENKCINTRIRIHLWLWLRVEMGIEGEKKTVEKHRKVIFN